MTHDNSRADTFGSKSTRWKPDPKPESKTAREKRLRAERERFKSEPNLDSLFDPGRATEALTGDGGVFSEPIPEWSKRGVTRQETT
jgi:hypothetical protein